MQNPIGYLDSQAQFTPIHPFSRFISPAPGEFFAFFSSATAAIQKCQGTSSTIPFSFFSRHHHASISTYCPMITSLPYTHPPSFSIVSVSIVFFHCFLPLSSIVLLSIVLSLLLSLVLSWIVYIPITCSGCPLSFSLWIPTCRCVVCLSCMYIVLIIDFGSPPAVVLSVVLTLSGVALTAEKLLP